LRDGGPNKILLLAESLNICPIQNWAGYATAPCVLHENRLVAPQYAQTKEVALTRELTCRLGGGRTVRAAAAIRRISILVVVSIVYSLVLCGFFVWTSTTGSLIKAIHGTAHSTTSNEHRLKHCVPALKAALQFDTVLISKMSNILNARVSSSNRYASSYRPFKRNWYSHSCLNRCRLRFKRSRAADNCPTTTIQLSRMSGTTDGRGSCGCIVQVDTILRQIFDLTSTARQLRDISAFWQALSHFLVCACPFVIASSRT